jgi:hypothetical protein
MKKLAIALLPLLAACGDPFHASVRADKVCVRQLDTRIEGGAAAALAAGPSGLPAELRRYEDKVEISSADLAEFKEKAEFDAALGLQSFKFKPPEGTVIENLHVVLTPPAGSGLPPVTLIQYPAPEGQAGLVTFENGEFVADLSPLGENLMEYVDSENLTLDLVADAALPENVSFDATVEVCSSAEADYDYL